MTPREVLRVRAHDRRRVAAALRFGHPDHPAPVAGPLLLGAVLAVLLAVAATGPPRPFAHAVGGLGTQVVPEAVLDSVADLPEWWGPTVSSSPASPVAPASRSGRR